MWFQSTNLENELLGCDFKKLTNKKFGLDLKATGTGQSMTKNFSYLLIGHGRLASHLRFYLQSQNIRVSAWNRREHTLEDFKKLSENCDHILLAIKDSAIEQFVAEHSFVPTHKWIHFSGSQSFSHITGVHPLMTFTEKLYHIDFYKKIPFISEKTHKNFRDLFPQLENPYFEIESSQKPLYHSLCVMSGNFTTLLWNKVFESFKTQLNLPPEVLVPYMQKITENLKDHVAKNLSTPLSGPLHRKDVQTIQSNLNALKEDDYLEIYKSFVRATDPNLFKELDI